MNWECHREAQSCFSCWPVQTMGGLWQFCAKHWSSKTRILGLQLVFSICQLNNATCESCASVRCLLPAHFSASWLVVPKAVFCLLCSKVPGSGGDEELPDHSCSVLLSVQKLFAQQIAFDWSCSNLSQQGLGWALQQLAGLFQDSANLRNSLVSSCLTWRKQASVMLYSMSPQAPSRLSSNRQRGRHGQVS